MRRLLAIAAVCFVTAASAAGQQAPVELKVGDQAPAFSLPGSDGRTHTLAESSGRAVVLAWFPAAFTGG